MSNSMFENIGIIVCLFDDGSKYAAPCGGRSMYDDPKGRAIIINETLPTCPAFVKGSTGKTMVGTKFLTEYEFFSGSEKEFDRLSEQEQKAPYDPWPVLA